MIRKRTYWILSLLLLLVVKSHGAEDSAWVQIFNGKDINDWVPKFAGHTVGINQNNAFQVNNGMLQVIQSKPLSETGFGHLFYNKRKFSYYLLRGQYRFLTDTSAYTASAGGWTTQNNGFMLHSQSAASMGLNQDFPNSIEHQIIGPWGKVNTPPRNANVCVPGTMISYKGQDYNDGNGHHCTDAKYHSLEYNKTLNNGTWLYSMAKVMSDSLMVFYVKSRADTAWDSVISFTNIRTTTNPVAQLKDGYITIQDEGSSIEFPKIEVLDLVGCMDKANSAYRSYFVKSNPSACATTAIQPQAAALAGPGPFRCLAREQGIQVEGPGVFTAQLLTLDGTVVAASTGSGSVRLAGSRAGVQLVRVNSSQGIFTVKLAMP